jgi:hypothetical protein
MQPGLFDTNVFRELLATLSHPPQTAFFVFVNGLRNVGVLDVFFNYWIARELL